MKQKDHQSHIPVLLDEVVEIVRARPGETLLDATAGYGGHSTAIMERTLKDEGSVLVDRDEAAVKELRQTFKGRPVQIIQDTFLNAARALNEEGKQFDIIVADLGVSSPHLDNIRRGFSFNTEAELDMRMDQSQALTAKQIVNEYSVDDLVRILHEYGEEPRARKIAGAIIENRPIQTTTELAAVVERALHVGWQKAHPATKTFQALRIAVNDELEQLKQVLPLWLQLLSPGGRLAIISFHSLEDRIVKQFLSDKAGNRYDAELKLLNKKPISATQTELVLNPRARSAKLRAAAKINKERDASNAYTGKK